MATEREVYNALTGAGLNMAEAAGLMGNIVNESHYDQEVVVTDSNGFKSYGLVQWNAASYPQASGYVTGNPAADLQHQVSAIVSAYRGLPMPSGNTARDAQQIAGIWAAQFERCQGCQPGGPQWQSRAQNAGRIFNQATSGSWPSGPGTPGQPPPNTTGVSAPGLLQELGNVWGIPFNFWTSAPSQVTGIVTATEDIAQAVAGIGNVASELQHLIGMLAWWFVPSHIVRVLAFLAGVPLVGFGIWNLSRTGQPYSLSVPVVGQVPASGGNLAPAIGIAEITLGSVLLFVAFHNLPATVVDLPSLLAYIQSAVAKPGGGGVLPE